MAVKYVGSKELLDPETGETHEFSVISKNYDNLDIKGWRRVVMADLMDAIEQIGNQKIKVLEFIIDNMDDKNQINLTQKQISEKTKISKQTITETFKALKNCNLIKKHGGVYVLNTTIVSAYGNNDKNRYLTIEYNFTGKSIVKKEIASEDAIQELQKLQKERELEKKAFEEQQKEIEELKKLLANQNLELATSTPLKLLKAN